MPLGSAWDCPLVAHRLVAAVNGYFFLPTYGTIIAAITSTGADDPDRTGSS